MRYPEQDQFKSSRYCERSEAAMVVRRQRWIASSLRFSGAGSTQSPDALASLSRQFPVLLLDPSGALVAEPGLGEES